MSPVYHVAGEPADMVQRCLRCRLVLACGRMQPFPPYRLVAEDHEDVWLATDASSDDVVQHLCENKVVIQ